MLYNPTLPPDHPRNRMRPEVDLKTQVINAAQARLDNFARERGYDGIISACTYVTSTVPKFATEAQTCVNLRDTTWNTLYTILAAVEAGTRPMPTFDEVIAELPALAWTN